MVKPAQAWLTLVNVGVTTMVATTGVVPVFTALKGKILPDPLDANPIVELLFIQEYVVAPPKLLDIKLTKPVAAPLQITWEVGWIRSADGFTVIVNVFDGPVQTTPALV